MTVGRTLYRCGRERAVVPMELRAGTVEGHWTPLAACQASRVVAQMTPSEGEALLRELGNMAPSKSSMDRLPKGLNARWEAHREAFESTLREAAVVPDEVVTVAVSLDGVMVPMKEAQRAEKRERSHAAGRRTKGPAGYQEAGCTTLSFYDAEGERLDTVSLARMPEPKKATLKTMLSVELDTVLGRRPDLEVVTVADGAHDNWRYLDALAPDAMRYADTQARHLPIGSGVVEAACRTLVTQRLKRSGMRWRRAGGQAILTLRSLLQSARFEQAWALVLQNLSSRCDRPR